MPSPRCLTPLGANHGSDDGSWDSCVAGYLYVKLRESSSRSLIPHMLRVGALLDEAWVRHGVRWVLIAEEGPEGPQGRRRLSARADGAGGVILDLGDRRERYLPGQLRPVETFR